MKHLILCALVGVGVVMFGRVEAQNSEEDLPPPDFIVRTNDGDTLVFEFSGISVRIHNRYTGDTIRGRWYY
jgi:hypothetical protein